MGMRCLYQLEVVNGQRVRYSKIVYHSSDLVIVSGFTSCSIYQKAYVNGLFIFLAVLLYKLNLNIELVHERHIDSFNFENLCCHKLLSLCLF
jgi:hypothetical protein